MDATAHDCHESDNILRFMEAVIFYHAVPKSTSCKIVTLAQKNELEYALFYKSNLTRLKFGKI